MAKIKKSEENFVKGIKDTRRLITVLFTDIENSTQMWETRGDIRGRLLVDRHNKLLFPVIKKFKGRILKTIGDSIMASFKDPGDAVKASIAMQQILLREREEDNKFNINIRVGIHTGKALVERGDIFGDVVNVAARVESESEADQILVSGSTAAKLKNKEFNLEKYGSFKPKGKKGEVNLFECEWDEQEDLIGNVNPSIMVSVFLQQKKELFMYILASLITLAFIYHAHLKYILSDSETAALWMLNPTRLPAENPSVFYMLLAIVAIVTIIFVRMKHVPLFWMNTLKGLSAFGFSLIAFYYLFRALTVGTEFYWEEPILESKHLFVEVLVGNAKLREEPSAASKVVTEPASGDLLLLNDVKTMPDRTWNRVLIANEQYAWIERVSPPAFGVAEERVTLTSKYYFRFFDLYALLISCLAFVWGYKRFKVRPI